MTITVDLKYIGKWIAYYTGWSDDYCLKHRIDKTAQGYYKDHYFCPECESEKINGKPKSQ
jgi:hypothetical protein